ncbi:hypothetical protein DNTS_017025 [Danionella cerebrum]|uniref:Dynactin subunit 3 n=1 Tax=Danionella cerebrum TaxID=2873325 RepID=A0A553MKP5_9TELE|nr:hypothetical protein DNTS_017025 [Danionella translucida]
MEEKNNIADLNARIEVLEKRIYGEKAGKPTKPVKCAESLTRISAALANTANKRERVKILHKKIEDLLKYLDPQFTDFIAVPDAVKLEFILAEEDFLRSQAVLLEQEQNEELSAEVKRLFEEYNKMMFLLSKQFSQWDETLRQLEAPKSAQQMD